MSDNPRYDLTKLRTALEAADGFMDALRHISVDVWGLEKYFRDTERTVRRFRKELEDEEKHQREMEKNP